MINPSGQHQVNLNDLINHLVNVNLIWMTQWVNQSVSDTSDKLTNPWIHPWTITNQATRPRTSQSFGIGGKMCLPCTAFTIYQNHLHSFLQYQNCLQNKSKKKHCLPDTTYPHQPHKIKLSLNSVNPSEHGQCSAQHNTGSYRTACIIYSIYVILQGWEAGKANVIHLLHVFPSSSSAYFNLFFKSLRTITTAWVLNQKFHITTKGIPFRTPNALR